MGFWQQALLRKTWLTWRDYALSKAQHSLKMQRALAYWAGGTLRGALLAWQQVGGAGDAGTVGRAECVQCTLRPSAAA